MDLKDFIKEAIKDISEAISECNDELKEVGTIANPKDVAAVNAQKTDNIYGYMLKANENSDYRRPVHLITFDVAVSSTKKQDGKEGIGVNVVGIKLGKDNNKTDEDSTSSRLKFAIPVALPAGQR
jgi:hypothetical protein